jgi:hypothetical protein
MNFLLEFIDEKIELDATTSEGFNPYKSMTLISVSSFHDKLNYFNISRANLSCVIRIMGDLVNLNLNKLPVLRALSGSLRKNDKSILSDSSRERRALFFCELLMSISIHSPQSQFCERKFTFKRSL